jgi:CubicO group peptidase (beta-lactamase class C family)
MRHLQTSRATAVALLLPLTFALAGWGPLPEGQPGAGELQDVLGNPAFPDDVWKASTPETEGMDPARLLAGVEAIGARKLAIHSFLVIRHGKLVLERYGKDGGRQLGPDDLHVLHSVTKTFTAALVGMAIADGKIPSVKARAMDWFPGEAIEARSESKDRMTLEDLLTMRSGLEWEEGPSDRVFRLRECAAEAVLSQPMAAAPGTHWQYSSGNAQILAEIVRRATGKSPLAFATERLFGPLGIKDLRWLVDDGGTQYGGWGLFLRPRDLARFGQLYLQRGRWQGKQVVPEAWVVESTRARTATPWPGGDYGYQVWVPKFGGFVLRGYLGQEVFVFPEKDLVVVFTADLPSNRADVVADQLVREYVLAALKG